jgi:ubiquinol-cytochrome c reductase cytochrome b subunit
MSKSNAWFPFRQQLRYSTPLILSTSWNLGILALVFLSIQIFSGIFLVINYIPEGTRAFESIERIMREINSGYLIRLLHNTTATFFFLAIYIHITRALYYGLYTFPGQKVWITGIFAWLIMMLAAFAGYVLPWGQMSYWALTVISNLLTIIPYAGNDIVILIWGSTTITNNTVTRLFMIHFLVPFVLLMIVAIHIVFLHSKKSSNPLTTNINTDTITFAPYYITKDLVITIIAFLGLAIYLYLKPYALLDADNSIYANPFVTPAHIVPEWYFLPYYAILRSSSSKTIGVLALFLAILSFMFLGNLFKNVSYTFLTPLYSTAHQIITIIFCTTFVVLLLLGSLPPIESVVYWSKISTWIYFGILGAGFEFVLYYEGILLKAVQFFNHRTCD